MPKLRVTLHQKRVQVRRIVHEIEVSDEVAANILTGDSLSAANQGKIDLWGGTVASLIPDDQWPQWKTHSTDLSVLNVRAAK